MSCPDCAGRGWVRTCADAPWQRCATCYGSGCVGTPVEGCPGFVFYPPPKPMPPALRVVRSESESS